MTIIRAEDWAALYVNGDLINEEHEVRIEDLKRACPIESIEDHYLSEEAEEKLHDAGRFDYLGWRRLADLPDGAIDNG